MIEPDFALVLGLVLAVLSVPAMMSAISDSRAPRFPALTLLIAGGLVIYALNTQPSGYRLEQIPDVFVRVLSQLFG